MQEYGTGVRLTWPEIVAGYVTSAARDIASYRGGFKQKRWGRPNDPAPENGVMGCLGETALAKFLDRYNPMGVNTFHLADVGGRYQARARRRYEPHHDLCVCPDDPDDHIYFLVWCHGWPYDWSIQGWITGADAKEIGTDIDGRRFVKAENLNRGDPP